MNRHKLGEYVINGIFWFFLVLLLIVVYARLNMVSPEPETSSTSIFSEDCVFHQKVTGGDFTIQELKGGAYRYEVYATSDSIEVWKCNKF